MKETISVLFDEIESKGWSFEEFLIATLKEKYYRNEGKHFIFFRITIPAFGGVIPDDHNYREFFFLKMPSKIDILNLLTPDEQDYFLNIYLPEDEEWEIENFSSAIAFDDEINI